MLAISSGGGAVVRRQAVAVRFLAKIAAAKSKMKSGSTKTAATKYPSSMAELNSSSKKTISAEGRNNKVPREIADYIRNVSGPNFPSLNILPGKSLRVVAKFEPAAYVIDSSVAERIGEILKERVEKKILDVSAPSLELSPGPGLLTSVLLSSVGLPAISVLEDDSKLESYLYERFGRDKVQVLRRDFSDLPRVHHMDKLDGGARIHTLFSSVKGHKKLQVFGTMPLVSEVNFLMKTLVSGQVFWAEDEVDAEKSDPGMSKKSVPEVKLWLILPASTYTSLVATPEDGKAMYRPNAVLFQLLFDKEELGTFDAKGWVPWLKTKGNGEESRLMHFVELSINKDTIRTVGGRDNLFCLWYFVRQHLFSRTRPIIPQLEAWIPGCGARLVRPPHRLTIFDTFGDRSPQEILHIFQTFISWPEFPHSSFLTAVEKFANRADDDAHRAEKGKSSLPGRDKKV